MVRLALPLVTREVELAKEDNIETHSEVVDSGLGHLLRLASDVFGRCGPHRA